MNEITPDTLLIPITQNLESTPKEKKRIGAQGVRPNRTNMLKKIPGLWNAYKANALLMKENPNGFFGD